MKYRFFTFHSSLFASLLLLTATMTTSCSDMLDTDSNLVMFQEDNKLHSVTDSVYSVMGIIYKLQAIGDRTVLLGDVRADLVAPTAAASVDLKSLYNFESTTDNKYNRISDYYAVINNCNYYLNNIDTALVRRGQKVFEYEYAAVKAFRAWTYLQAALVYGNVPLLTEPVLTEKEAEAALDKNVQDLQGICNYFITDLAPYVDTHVPQYGSIYGYNSKYFFIPVRALLGELCLWSGRYEEACKYYHDYFTNENERIPVRTVNSRWGNISFQSINTGYRNVFDFESNETRWAIPYEITEFEGIETDLQNIYSSTQRNYYYYQLTPSKAMADLSAAQDYCIINQISDVKSDTLYAPKDNLLFDDAEGDLRFMSIYSHSVIKQDDNSRFSSDYQSISKFWNDCIVLYRTNILYLHYAEALNRAGYPQAAFAVLKYGLYEEGNVKYIDDAEREAAGSLISFPKEHFDESNTQGIHSRGSGDSRANQHYVMPQPAEELASRADTVAYQQPLVEDLIVNELALEGAFEGYRYYDLMRVALRRNDPAYLAKPISMRNGTQDAALYNKLLDPTNWYLKK